MNAAATKPPSGDESTEADDDWRASLLRRIRIVVVMLIFLGGAATLVGFRSEPMRIFGVALLVHSVVLIGLLWAPVISQVAKTAIVLLSLTAASVAAFLIAGFLPGGMLTAALVMVLTVLLVDHTAFIVTLVAYTLFVVGLFLAVATGFWEGPNPIDVTPADPTNWFRTGLVAVTLWASLGFSVSFVVGTIERNLARRKAAVERLEQEIAERRAAEAARREAEAVAHQAQKLDAVGQLAAGVAHDFNNALLVIKGWNEMRASLDTTEEQREATHAIEQAAEQTARLSGQLLTFARKEVRTPKYLRLDLLVRETAPTLRHLVGARVNLQFDIQDDIVIHGDEAQIQQLLYNLVINARDAVDRQGNVKVSLREATHVEIESLDKEADRWIVLAIEDDGPGIDEVNQQRVFEPFYTTKAPGKGTGLGLSTAFGIAEQHGGSINLSSKPGQTRFSIYLPSTDIEQFDSTKAVEQNSASMPALRALVLEDDELARQMIVTALRRDGHDVVECGDGDTTLALLSDDARPYDLICSDAVFPGAALETVLEAFEEQSPRGKVLICSGYVEQELAIRKLESGDYAFLAKPFTGKRLISRIQEVVHGTLNQN